MKNLGWSSTCIVLAALSAGCSKMAFQNIPVASTLSSPKCEPGTVKVSKPTKFIFLVDTTGSNAHGNPQVNQPDGPPTDPNKSFRYNVINDFFQEHGREDNLSWSFMTFSNSMAHALVNTGDDQHPAFSDIMAMTNALQLFLGTTDVGNTPYKLALNMAKTLIQQDKANLATQSQPTQYRIAMITDGYPTDYCPGGPAEIFCAGHVKDSELMADVQSLVNSAPGAVKLSTVYYGEPDDDSTNRLNAMATHGGGQFVDLNKTSNIKLDNIIEIPTQICP